MLIIPLLQALPWGLNEIACVQCFSHNKWTMLLPVFPPCPPKQGEPDCSDIIIPQWRKACMTFYTNRTVKFRIAEKALVWILLTTKAPRILSDELPDLHLNSSPPFALLRVKWPRFQTIPLLTLGSISLLNPPYLAEKPVLYHLQVFLFQLAWTFFFSDCVTE